MAVAQRLLHSKEGLAPPEAEKLTAPVSLTRPSTVTPGATAAATWATTSAAPAGTLALGCGAGSTGVPTTRGDGTSLAGASSVASGGPMTCVSGVRWGDGWASRLYRSRESSGRKFDSPGFLRGEGARPLTYSLAPLALISGRLNTCERWDGCVVGGRVAAIERVAFISGRE